MYDRCHNATRRPVLVGLATAMLIALIAPFASAGDAIELLGVAELPGKATDQSGLDNLLDGSTPHNRLGGLSAIEYSGANDLYYALSDRGPMDGSARYACRFHTIELKVAPGSRERSTARLVATTLLTAPDGKSFIGLASAFDPHGPDGDRRLDPEAIRRGPSGNLFISDEYGPKVLEFDSSGHALRSLAVPSRFQIRHPAATKEEEIARNKSGRVANGGFEGLAISADGKRLYALAQVPLLQDSKAGKSGKRKGLSCRLLEIDLPTAATREFLYPLDGPTTKLSEIVAAGDGRFLVIERDGAPGEKAAFKRIMAINVKQASDTSGIESFPAKGLPPGVRAVKKSVFIDLLDPKLGIAGSKCPEKFEGLAWGPSLADGRDLLWICVDNDFKAEAPSLFYAFAVRRPQAEAAR